MPVMVAAVVTMSAAQLLDLATFMRMMRVLGPSAEANPLVAVLFASYGFPLVAIAKVVVLAMATGIAAVLAGRLDRRALAGAVVAAAILVGVLGSLSNVVALGTVDAAIHHLGMGGP